jgi:hypothetical protein
MLSRVWSDRNSPSLLIGMQNDLYYSGSEFHQFLTKLNILNYLEGRDGRIALQSQPSWIEAK